MSDLSPKTIFEETLPKKFADHPEQVEGFEAIYLFDIAGDDGGKWTLVCDGSVATIEVGEPDEAMCTISMDDTDFVDMMKGDLNPMMAFSVGKLRVAGDIGLAIKIQSILG
jgi:putative sterol carrier protein